MRKNWKFLSVLLLLLTIFVVSCDKDIIQNDPVTNNSIKVRSLSELSGAVDTISCYEFVYPLQLKNEKGKVFTVNSATELLDLFETEKIWDFVYPYKMKKLTDESVIEIAKSSDIDELLTGCGEITPPTEGGNIYAYRMAYVVENADSLGCYNFKYPLSFLIKNETGEKTLVLNSYEEFLALMVSETDTILEIIYPYTLVELSSEQEVVINKAEDVEIALNNCSTYTGGTESGLAGQLIYIVENGDSLGCYNFKYPMQYIIEDGDIQKTITLNSYSDFLALMKSEEAIIDFVYPFTLVKMDDGSEIIISEKKDIEEALHNCTTFTSGSEN